MAHMAVKCRIFMNCSKNFLGVIPKKKKKKIVKQYLRDHRCERINMVYKFKIFVAVTEHFMGISILYRYICVCSFKSY